LNIGEPIHERLTEKALKAAGILGAEGKYTDDIAWQYVRGALWNDDPEGLLFDDRVWYKWFKKSEKKYSSGVEFVLKFKEAKVQAFAGTEFGPNEVSLLKRSHFGDLQFLHGMAMQGERAATTRDKMVQWAEFTYKVGTGVIAAGTTLGNVPVSGIPELFPKLKALTVQELFKLRDLEPGSRKLEQRALGSLMHMIQDSYAAGHTERDATLGKIKQFHSYVGQDEKLHAAKDVPSGYSEQEYSQRQKAAVDACASVLKHALAKDAWSPKVKKTIMAILGLDHDALPAAPGKEFIAPRNETRSGDLDPSTYGGFGAFK
jgi:hypothetical protein